MGYGDGAVIVAVPEQHWHVDLIQSETGWARPHRIVLHHAVRAVAPSFPEQLRENGSQAAFENILVGGRREISVKALSETLGTIACLFERPPHENPR